MSALEIAPGFIGGIGKVDGEPALLQGIGHNVTNEDFVLN
jgi:hypothetical protein